MHAVPLDDLIRLEGFASPAFLPDGSGLLCLGPADNGLNQVWVVPLTGERPRQLTALDERVMLARSSPSGDKILIAVDAGGDEHAQLSLVPTAGGTRTVLTQAPKVIHSFGAWSPDGTSIVYASNGRDRAWFDLHRRDLATGKVETLFEGGEGLSVGGWQPGGDWIAATEDHSHFNVDLFLIDAKTRERIDVRQAERTARALAPRWSKDGRHLFLLGDGEREFLGLGRFSPAEDKIEWLYTPDCDLDTFAIAPDGRLAAALNLNGYSRLEILTPDGIPTGVAVEPGGVVTDVSWSPDGRRLAFAFSTATAGSRIRLLDPVAGTVTQPIADESAGRYATTLARPSTIRFPTFDGLQIPGYFFRPRGATPSRGWPAVLFVHGGPEWQIRPSYRHDIQALVEAGYAVMMPNVRGSTGYGRRYASLDDREKRMDSVRDLAAAGRWLKRQADIDGKRLAVMGESYGGFMVLSALAEQPELWTAGVEIFGVVNFDTLLSTTGPWRRRHRAAEYGDPKTDPDLMRWLSPIGRADKIRAPLFVSHGDRDPRVPKGESDQIVKFLKERQRIVEYQEIAYEGHVYWRPANKRATAAAVNEFLAKHMPG